MIVSPQRDTLNHTGLGPALVALVAMVALKKKKGQHMYFSNLMQII